MKTEIDQLPIELCKTLLSVVEDLPSNVQLFWARNKELLEDTLNRVRAFEPVTFPDSEPYRLPAIKATTRKILSKKGLMRKMQGEEFTRCVLEHQPPQPACLLQPCDLHVDLRGRELFKELGIDSADNLASNAFSYSQIVAVLARHSDEKKKGGIVFYERTTYFPLMLPTGKVEFVGFLSRKPWGTHTSWQGYFAGAEPSMFSKGRLLLRVKDL